MSQGAHSLVVGLRFEPKVPVQLNELLRRAERPIVDGFLKHRGAAGAAQHYALLDVVPEPTGCALHDD